MARLQNTPTSAVGSSAHLLWLAMMGLRDHYFIVAEKDGKDKIFNNGMRFVAYDLLLNLKRDNDKNNI